MRHRRMIVGGVVACIATTLVVVVVLGSSGKADLHGLSPQKVADLAKHGLTPDQYLRIEERGAAHQAAAEHEPPADPNAVGPRLIREEHGPELLAWKQFYGAKNHANVSESWSVQVVGEKRTIATLQLVTDSGGRDALPEPAKWAFNFSLSANSPTPAEERIANGPHAVEALTPSARKLESLPAPQAGLSLPVSLFGDETLSPGFRTVVVDVYSAHSYESWLVMRRGKLDEPLLRGKALARRAPPEIKYLKLSKHVAIFKEPVSFGEAKAGIKRRSSIYELNRLFNNGPVPLILGWKSGAHNINDLLRRPVQELIILSP